MSAAVAIPEIPKEAKEYFIAAHPVGEPKPSDIGLRTVQLPELQDGEVLVVVQSASVDPYLRGTMNKGVAYGKERYVGRVFGGVSAGVVVATKNPDYPVGTQVNGDLGWVTAAVVDPKKEPLTKTPASWKPRYTLGILGMPGATGYFGTKDVMQVKEGNVVFISSASGAVGSLVGQLSKIYGAKVYGSVSTEAKRKLCLDLGFDGALVYKGKSIEQLQEEILELTGGKKIDRYFENTGGPVSDAVLNLLNMRARIAICGQITLYNAASPEDFEKPDVGVSRASFLKLLGSGATAQGFYGWDYTDQWETGLQEVADWIESGKIKVVEDVSQGFESLPDAFFGLFSGSNVGKKCVEF